MGPLPAFSEADGDRMAETVICVEKRACRWIGVVPSLQLEQILPPIYIAVGKVIDSIIWAAGKLVKIGEAVGRDREAARNRSAKTQKNNCNCTAVVRSAVDAKTRRLPATAAVGTRLTPWHSRKTTCPNENKREDWQNVAEMPAES